MNILLVSECDKRALTETRRILDQFAERRGERTWQTPITQAGLDTLRKLLRKSARKNTAVACHWIRGVDHSELLWVVGDARRFNTEGAVPTNTTTHNILRKDDENTWHSLHAIGALTALAALLHDLGKASIAFQERLRGQGQAKNLYRHEWVSVRLFQAFVGGDNDADWLQRLIASDQRDSLKHWLDKLQCDGKESTKKHDKPLKTLPPLARAIAWLILTHHRLPTLPFRGRDKYIYHGMPNNHINSAELTNAHVSVEAIWNEPYLLNEAPHNLNAAPYWAFQHGLPVIERAWHKRAARHARQLLPIVQTQPEFDWLQDPFITHVSRLCLMLADHYYSSQSQDEKSLTVRASFRNTAYPLHANTANGQLNQTLDEHLSGVAAHTGAVVRALPGLARNLSHLQHHKGLKKRSTNPAFRWQNRAADMAASVRQSAAEQGAFIVNMASTGCGKTLGNARIMNALADPVRGLRCAFAIGLRTLTLQTGRSFQHNLGLDDEALAILVGGSANRELFEHYEAQAESTGSESRTELLLENSHVQFEGNDDHPLLQRLTHNPSVRKMLAAPLLVCTVDHLMPATESLRGGGQIAPMLRLFSGDLVLDEPDDFDIDDLPALTRLVHFAGLLGSRVLLSSATLPPALVEGLFLAYRAGRQWFERNCSPRPDASSNICCLWLDEFSQQHSDCADADAFRITHLEFVGKRVKFLKQQQPRRRAEILPLPFTSHNRAQRREELATLLRDAALALHDLHYSTDPKTGQRVSFGLIRMANIDPLFDVAQALFQLGSIPGKQIHLCVYHSQFPLFVRSIIEQQLDRALYRRNAQAVFHLDEIRQRLDAHPHDEHLFIVLGSPVTEVGRDHDYDWAIVEPSSMRSLIQLAGRVRRHRTDSVTHPNLRILEYNLRHFEYPKQAAYCHPGFEGVGFGLNDHNIRTLLGDLLDANGQAIIDACPRILPAADAALRPAERLIDLEHVRLREQMLPRPSPRPPRRNQSPPPPPLNASSYWNRPYASLTGLLQQRDPFRQQTQRDEELVFLPDEGEHDIHLHRLTQGERRGKPRYAPPPAEKKLIWIPDTALNGPNIHAWGVLNLLSAMSEQAEAMGLSLSDFAHKFATVSLRKGADFQGWRFHPTLGFTLE